MATTEEVKKLAALARITIADAELEAFTKEFDAILGYVETVSTVEMPHGEDVRRGQTLRNVMRADGAPHVPGAFTQMLAEQFPAREGDALVVKQIISHG